MNALTEFSRLSGSLFIDGAARTSDTTERLDIIDPATEDRIGEMSDATEAEVDEAIAIANQAQKTWDAMNPLHRAELMHECGRKMAEITPMVSEMMTREMGKPYKESADELQWGISVYDVVTGIAADAPRPSLGGHIEAGHRCQQRHTEFRANDQLPRVIEGAKLQRPSINHRHHTLGIITY